MNASELLAAATAEPIKVTVRELLAAWGFRARTYESVDRVTQDLSGAGLSCQPDISEGGLDTLVRVCLGETDDDVSAETGGDEPLQLPTLAPRIRDIPSATGGVIWVSPDHDLGSARGMMIENEVSQLPVLASERELVGYVSWHTIAQRQLTTSPVTLADVTRQPQVVGVDDPLLDHVETIYKADFVFVRGADSRICGIVTSADLSYQFRELTTPYFQVGEIENRLRICIDRVFSLEELRQGSGDPRLASARDMMFGQYVRLLRDGSRWSQMHWDGINHARFIECLDDTRKIRNKIMHFGEDLTVEQRNRLLQCLNYMRTMLPLP